MNQDVKVTCHNKPFPYSYVENVYSDKELELIWKELDYYQSQKDLFFSADANMSAGAKLAGVSLKKNNGFFMQEVYSSARHSPLIKATGGLFGPQLFQQRESHLFDEFHPMMKGFLLSYYEDGDYYQSHKDQDVASIVIWLWKEPKQFEGGNFSFTEYPDLKIENRHNCAVMFPGYIKHQVNTVKMEEENLGCGLGRYSCTLFLDHLVEQPQQQQPLNPNYQVGNR